MGEPNPDDARHAGPGADGLRRAARVRPPAPRGDGAGQRRSRRRRPRARLRGRRRRDRRRARAAGRAGPARARAGAREPPEFTSNIGSDGYAAAVERAKEYIRAGDIYQVVPSQRWSADCPVEAFSIYRGLRAINPSPYMYFLDFEDFEIAGASPESLVTVTGRTVPRSARSPARARAPTRVEEDLQRAERAAGRREGARRARDARGPRPQRPRARVRVRLGAGRRADGRRDLLARDAHRLVGVRHAARGRDRRWTRCARRCPRARCRARRRSARCRSSTSSSRSTRGPYGGAVGYLSYTGDLDTCIYIRSALVSRTAACTSRPAAASSPTRTRPTRCARRRPRRAP